MQNKLEFATNFSPKNYGHQQLESKKRRRKNCVNKHTNFDEPLMRNNIDYNNYYDSLNVSMVPPIANLFELNNTIVFFFILL